MANTMKAAIYHGAGDVRIERHPMPEAQIGEVLIRVTRSGVCGTDASEWKSGPKIFPVNHVHPNSGHRGPMVFGHEFIGEIVDSKSTDFQVGERVASGAGVSCGECARCLEDRTNLCDHYKTFGLNIDGGMAEYVAVPAATLVRIPTEVPDDRAGLAQPLAVGLHAARRANVQPGDKVVLIGAGAIGTFVLAGIKHLVDAEVVVSDFAGHRLERAERLGAARTIAVDADDYEARIAELAKTADVVIEASGAPGQLNRAIALVRDGGTILQVGLPTKQQEVDIHTLVFREIVITTTLAHVCKDDMPDSLEILKSPALQDELLDSVRPLEDLAEQLQLLATGQIEGKILFDPSL
ncbi:MAG: zinc-dependent alcohol dehydrogenase [Gulosibacter sp.]|uniref:zinc-dependent alcohol dehydrogenase n=1 Tax=Gulosibacter sp. TaxID=2817531 RepID=UPI003F910FB1